VGKFASANTGTSAPISLSPEWPPSSFTPSSGGNWLRPISIAAADVKPLITAWDMKRTMKPSRTKPMASMMTPTKRASRAAKPMYSGEPGSARPEHAVYTIKETTATGPTANWGDDPSSPYTSRGIVAA